MSNKKGLNGIVLVLLFVLIVVQGGFANGQNEVDLKSDSAGELSGKLVVWSFTNELGTIADMFMDANPGVEIEFVEIPNQDEAYLSKVNQTLRLGLKVPDVFTGELSYVTQFIEAGYFANLSELGADEVADDMIQYALDLGRDPEGDIRAMSWQATPGALFYRRSIAKDVIGSDDPAEVSKYTSSLEGFYELGAMINEKYNGEKTLIGGYNEMFFFVNNFRGQWIQNNKLVIDEAMLDYMEMAKKMRVEGLEKAAGQWSAPWFSGMADGSVMTYVLPTWGLHYVLKPSAEPEANKGEVDFTGDWGLAAPPAPYFSGGTWAGVNENSKDKELAWQFVKYITTNKDFLEAYAKKTGDFIGNERVVNQIKGDFSEPFLGGQNHYDFFAKEAEKIDVSNIGPYDLQINNAFGDAVSLYVDGDMPKEEAIQAFKEAVQEILPEIDVQ